jgi:Thiol-disulfide isomerase and thioredoxins
MLKKSAFAFTVVLFATSACGNTGSTGTSGAPDGGSGVSAGVSRPVSSAKESATTKLPHGYDPGRNAQSDITAAIKEAKADNRPVLLDFGADWCPDCVVLGKLFQSGTVKPVVSDFHVVAVDVGQFDRNVAVAAKYGLDLKRSGIPALVVIGPDGKVRRTTNDGSFANARTMTASQVMGVLKRWR